MEELFLIVCLLLLYLFAKCSDKGNKTERQKEYRKYLNSVNWMETKALAKKRAGYRCQLCGSTKYLQVHHNNYSNLGHEEPTDLVVLCRSCHARHHHKKY